jgi:hypothetical protein
MAASLSYATLHSGDEVEFRMVKSGGSVSVTTHIVDEVIVISNRDFYIKFRNDDREGAFAGLSIRSRPPTTFF